MESCSDQHHSKWFVCHYTSIHAALPILHDGCSDHQPGDTDVYTNRAVVSKQYSTCTAVHIEQSYYRDMESCSDQHHSKWFVCLYTSSGTVCHTIHDGCSDHQPGDTDVYTNRAVVSKQYSTCTADHIEIGRATYRECCKNQKHSK